jgi:Tfp pilus assembly protein PilX
MSVRRKLFKAVIFNLKKLSNQILSTIKKQIIWLLRTIFTTNIRRGTGNAGFVLPTVAMVSLVVVLLTTAILFRSFERSKNASNVRVNEAALNAATPAIDRARAKLNKLFKDGSLPRATPTDDALYSTLDAKINEYTFGDETQLRLTLNNVEKARRSEDSEKNKELKTAWLYPVDTDNNGAFDSYTLYGIYFRNPPINAGVYKYGRNPLEARTPPMTATNVSGDCGDTLGTSATLVGNTGWFKVGNKLKKAFFVYTATVPITNPPASNTNYETYKGNKSFSGLEYQQERIQIPVVNNAVLYEDDMGLSPGPAFRLNGRIFTNSNFLTGSPNNSVTLYQVSSKASCFYDEENAKIVIGGNLGAGGFTDASDLGNVTKVHLFRKGEATDPVEVDFAKSTAPAANEANLIAYNSLAYVQRINRLVNAQIANTTNPDPAEVTSGIQQQKDKLGLASYTTAEELTLRKQQLQLYFQKRTRRVPYQEVPSGSIESVALGTYVTTTPLQGSGDTLRPVNAWMYPTDPTDGKTGTNYTSLTLNISSGKLIPGATEPTKLQKDYEGKEQSLGDRIIIGNNLPQIWWDSNQNRFVGPNPQDTQNISGIDWDIPTASPIPRTRRSRVEILADLGSTERDKDWELAAAKVPNNIQDPVGGLRVVTGAGIYLPKAYTTTGSATDNNFAIATAATTNIWSDLMPVASTTATSATATSQPDNANITLLNATYTPYLRMRATAVYHYKAASYNAATPTPIACVSSYYDPTNSTTANNLSTLPSGNATGGRSNNGIVYAPPSRTTTYYQNVLTYQAQLKYENGRWANEALKNALAKAAANRTIAEQSAIDSAICSLQILDGSITVPATLPIPHGAIKEIAFLDARQVKAIHKDNTTDTPAVFETFTNADGGATPTTDYDLDRKDRQPLEIRATALDINLLRTTTIGGTTPAQEYLLPNSGIIYATRNDALPDLSSSSGDLEAKKLESPVDYMLDPTRRPNAIMLVNGSIIGRGTSNDYRDVEKGLILATNLPVYVKGNFNLHTQQEFGTPSDTSGYLADNWSNFYTRTKAQRNPNFACRPNDIRLPNCTTGDLWRPASVLADSITLLSNNFREGFRNEGDYDQNDNLGKRASGFNSYVTNWYYKNDPSKKWFYDIGDSGVTATTSPKYLFPKDFVGSDFDPAAPSTYQGSSYLNNFVTPIQLVTRTREFATEVCIAANSADCSDNTNWVIAVGGNCNGLTSQKTAGNSDGIIGQPLTAVKTGTVVEPPTCTEAQNVPRRIAFKRNSDGSLFLQNGKPVVYGFIKESGTAKLQLFPYDTWSTKKPGYPEENRGSSNPIPIPWFKTQDPASGTESFNSDNPPLLSSQSGQGILLQKPVLQIDLPFAYDSLDTSDISAGKHRYWLQVATETTFNLIAAAGDTPARPTEDNGGLHNFVRFMENWNPTGTTSDAIKARISGSFIQIKRSAYATAPFNTSISTQSDDFKYKIQGNNSRTPFYLAPTRQWGYDVALLSQSPDLLAQKLVTIPDDLPDEYFREVGRDDTWIANLLCAKDTKGTVATSDDTDALDQSQRPANCPS